MNATVITRDEAIEVGLDRYWPGVPCARGHVGEHYVANGACVECNDQLTPAQFAYLFREVQDSATFNRARKAVRTWEEWRDFLAKWDAEHKPEEEEAVVEKRVYQRERRARQPGRGKPFSIRRRVRNQHLFT